jgi:hypothetical protein
MRSRAADSYIVALNNPALALAKMVQIDVIAAEVPVDLLVRQP